MTVLEWRSSKERVKAARRILDDPTFVEIRRILEENSPHCAEKLAYGAAITDGDRNRFLGRIEGYQACLANMKALGEWSPQPREARATYEPPEE